MVCIVARSRKIEKKRKKKKFDCHVMHLKNSIESKRKSRKPIFKKKIEKKMNENYNLFLLQGFALQFR